MRAWLYIAFTIFAAFVIRRLHRGADVTSSRQSDAGAPNPRDPRMPLRAAGRTFAGLLIASLGVLYIYGEIEASRFAEQAHEVDATVVHQEVLFGVDRAKRRVALRVAPDPGPDVPEWARGRELSGEFSARFEAFEAGDRITLRLDPTEAGSWLPVADRTFMGWVTLLLLPLTTLVVGGSLCFSGISRIRGWRRATIRDRT